MTIIGETLAIARMAMWLDENPQAVWWEMKKFPNGTRFLRIAAPPGWQAIIAPRRRRVWLVVNDPHDEMREFEVGSYSDEPQVIWGRVRWQMQSVYTIAGRPTVGQFDNPVQDESGSFHRMRNDPRQRFGMIVWDDSRHGYGDLCQLFDLGQPPLANPEDLNQWVATWTSTLLARLTDISTPHDNIEQIQMMPGLVMWNDRRCVGEGCAPSNTMASLVLMSLREQGLTQRQDCSIYGPVLITGHIDVDWHPWKPPGPLSQQQLHSLFESSAKANAWLNVMQR